MPAEKSSSQLDVAFTTRAELGEGPLWSMREQCLYWVDLTGKQVHRSDPATGLDRAIALPGMVGAVVERERGGLAVAWQRGFAGLDFASGTLEPWCDPEQALPGNRFNDGKVDVRGRWWAGTMSIAPPFEGKGTLYCLDRDRRARAVRSGLAISNGLAWSGDGRIMYHIDSLNHAVAAYPFDGDVGIVGEPRIVVRADTTNMGYLDGMCIDADDMLWIAHCNVGCVTRWDPRDGRLLSRIQLPVTHAASCCFGGEALDRLFITTGHLGLDAAQREREPHAGSVFVLHTGSIGLASTPFAG